jgi:hypothetical protein
VTLKKTKKANFTYLGGEVEAQVTAAKRILNQQRHLLGQVQFYRRGQVGGLAEVDKVLEGEGQGNGLREVNGNVLVGLVDIGVLADGNGAVTNVAGAGELDTLLAGLDDDYREREGRISVISQLM